MTRVASDGSALIPSYAGLGVTDGGVEFALHGALPERLSSDDEPHWIFSFHDLYFAKELLSIGVTPFGKLAFGTPDGSVTLSEAGVIAPDGVKHSVVFSWLGDSGQAVIDGSIYIGPSSVPTTDAVPLTVGVVAFLNGSNALSKFRAAVHSAYLYWNESLGNVYKTEWKVTEGSGDVIACTGTSIAGTPTLLPALDFNLYRQWMYEYTQPWPVTFDGDPGSASSWVIRTPYTRRTRAATQYRKRRVSWLS